jgi:hypothetical protein
MGTSGNASRDCRPLTKGITPKRHRSARVVSSMPRSNALSEAIDTFPGGDRESTQKIAL